MSLEMMALREELAVNDKFSINFAHQCLSLFYK